MSKIASGPLLLRFAIVKDETGELFDLLLTSNGVGNVVTVEPEIFQIPPSGRQIWYAVEGEEKGYYKIIQDPASECPPGLAKAKDSDKVILSHPPGEWRLDLVSSIQIPNVYEIHPPPPGRIGIYQLLGKEGHDAVIQTFPVYPGNPNPAWQIKGQII